MTRVRSAITRQALLVLDGVYDSDNPPERLALFDQFGNPIVLEGTHGVPPGGNSGQLFGKLSDDDWDAGWIDVGGGAMVPAGGTTGQVLAKASNSDGDTTWVDSGGGSSKPYVDVVQSIPGLNLYLPLQADLDALVGADSTALGGAAVAADGTLPPGLGGHSVSFNGLNQALQVPLDLQSPAVTIFMWAYLPNQGDSDNILAELGAGAAENNSFMLDLTSGGGLFINVKGTSSASPIWSFPADHRTEDGLWHSISVSFDRAYTGGGLRVEGFLDGFREQTTTAGDLGTADFAAMTLNLMSRNGASLWTQGKLAHVAVYDRRLLAHEQAYLASAHMLT